jgi:2-keto-4-pentenoate hydratase/2-oxohepta-3-ene-1,7-dioic acid hydratase in catechol pathway
MLVDVPSAVEFFSSFTRLVPGDVIATGTPGGVGFARTPPVWMHPGDVIEVSVEGLGTIRNRVVAEEGAPEDWRWRPGAPLKSGF